MKFKTFSLAGYLALIWGTGGTLSVAAPPTIEISQPAPLPVWFVPLSDTSKYPGWELRSPWDIPSEFPWKNRLSEMTSFWFAHFIGRSILVRVPSPPMTEPLGRVEFISHTISAESDPAAMLATVKSAALNEALFEPGYLTAVPFKLHPIELLDLFSVDGSGKLAKVITQDMPVRDLVLPFCGVGDALERLVLPESLEKLVIYNTTFDSRFIEKLARCPKLREVAFLGLFHG